MTDPYITELQRLRQEFDHLERLQDLPDPPDDFTISVRMWAVVVCVGAALWTVIIGLLGRAMGAW